MMFLQAAKSSNTLASAQSFRSMVKGEGSKEMHVTLPEDGLDWANTWAIKYSSTVLIRRKASEKLYAVDTIACDSSYDLSRLRTDTESLAKKLKREDIELFGLLPCKGVVKRKSPETKRLASMSLAFQLPGTDLRRPPISLRNLLLQERMLSLTRVVEIAEQLARACEIFSAYLLGFDSFRNVNFHTLKVGDDAWERNLYRHPTRQGIQAQEAYIMQHDVYSLGVCLLELGLWDSFVEYNSVAGEACSDKVPGTGLGLSLSDFDFQPGNIEQTFKIKNQLVGLARAGLPARMGDKYASAVITCLTCLDEDSEEFGGEDMQDEDGIMVGVRFIEKVLMKLGDINV
ncbi:hypothetical protein CFRS1_v006871 [Colletotrichum fructicola]|nr:hypothetical protein CFRS1_v006871 [Colletotrichum fructicola]